MSLIRSLTSGTSSLMAHQQRLDVISNNIANVNTIGYKSSRITFADQFNQTFNLGSAPSVGGAIGGVDPLQIGLGVKIGGINMDLSQGAIQTTNRPTDLALQGDGYFIVKRNGQELYTRAGTFSFDRDGMLIDSATGAHVQGYNLSTDAAGLVQKDANGVNILNRKVTDVQISPTFKSAPRQTQSVTIAGNLNSGVAIGGPAVNPTVTVFDNQGGEHVLRLEFTKTAANTFSLKTFIDGDTANPIGAAQTVTFNSDGTLNTPLNFQVTAANINTALTAIGSAASFDATTPKDITINLATANDLLGGLTQFAAQDTVSTTDQDGYAAGDLQKVTVDQTGKIIGAFTNGQSELLGQVVMAKFTNSSGLLKEGNNFFAVSPNSGLPHVGTAVEIFPSTSIASGALEESNVDLTSQFTDMITTQRAFEAASRTITVSDQFLSEINQLKR